MPANTQYLIAAYGIVLTVLFVYGLSLVLKLKAINNKLKKLKKTTVNEKEES